MARTVTTEEELADAIKDDEDMIIIEGELGDIVFRIKATGKVAWVVAFGAIGVAVTSVIMTGATGGTGAPATVPTAAFTAPIAVGIIGAPATLSCIGIAVAAGGIGVLKKLRGYNLKKEGEKVILIKS